jgi:hypothetical protein
VLQPSILTFLYPLCLPPEESEQIWCEGGKKRQWEEAEIALRMASFHPKNPEIKRSFHSLLSRRKHGVISQGAV